ncbi:unnamed protein product [Cylicocyclus nassatus]|uniref:Uncharacterized protein n=1 Tax=Cylicocyclus nassatus TaxID=53992 RepID=A0AA36DQB3_CYLNA|nr:unnamed protein product [Cylicocyclus nassatus]
MPYRFEADEVDEEPSIMQQENVTEGPLACNCQYPIILIAVMVITILILCVCVSLCCIDVTSLSPFKKQTAKVRTRCVPIMDASKFVKRKGSFFSENGGIPGYKMLNNSMSIESCTCSVPLSHSSHSEASLVSTV